MIAIRTTFLGSTPPVECLVMVAWKGATCQLSPLSSVTHGAPCEASIALLGLFGSQAIQCTAEPCAPMTLPAPKLSIDSHQISEVPFMTTLTLETQGVQVEPPLTDL